MNHRSNPQQAVLNSHHLCNSWWTLQSYSSLHRHNVQYFQAWTNSTIYIHTNETRWLWCNWKDYCIRLHVNYYIVPNWVEVDTGYFIRRNLSTSQWVIIVIVRRSINPNCGWKCPVKFSALVGIHSIWLCAIGNQNCLEVVCLFWGRLLYIVKHIQLIILTILVFGSNTFSQYATSIHVPLK